jgi:hypothetical protein
MDSQEYLLPFDMKTIVTGNSGAVALPAKVNAVTVRNTGNTNLFWDSDLIVPGDFKGFVGNRAELFKGTVMLKFALPAIVPASPQNMAVVSCKFYIEYNP